MNQCYACKNKAVNKEHVPPQCLFPEEKDIGSNLRKNLITVPSCEQHNLEKSGDDEYLLYILSMNVFSEGVGEKQFATKVARAINRRPSLMKSLFSKSQPVIMNDMVQNEVYESLQFEVDERRVVNALKHIALGIYRSYFDNPWLGGIRVIPEFLHYTTASEIDDAINAVKIMAEKLFANEERYGENQKVFYYQIAKQQKKYHSIMRLAFYSGCKVTVLFK